MTDSFKNGFKAQSIIVFFVSLFFFVNIALAEKIETADLWKCFDLLDGQTRSSLSSFEDFFGGLFELPSKYKSASERKKREFVDKWIRVLEGSDYNSITKYAAYAGMVRAKGAARAVEKVISSGRGRGRLRWVCARSLGQIGDIESIPVLINFLNDRNANTRVYARVALAEITGVYFGDDKEKWDSWQSGELPQLCTSDECNILKPSLKSPDVRRSFSSGKLDFSLPDMYGRIVDSRDYADAAVLIMSGSCWCGGCQQDAEPLRKIAAEYGGKGLATIRTVAGDNELAALDFGKHYKLPFVQLLDTNRKFEKRYNRDGWTFLMLADRDGKIVYKKNGPGEEDWSELRGILDEMLLSGKPNETIIRDGTGYMPGTLRRSREMEKQRVCERFPSIACGEDGQMYVVFTSNRSGSDDVFLRVFDGGKWSEDIAVAATSGDEYDGTVLVDNEGRVWVCWTSDGVGRRYDIFATSFTNALQLGKPVRITKSEDDAMHARMACDKKGRVWITYYKWRKMRGFSRDKEVYVRKYEDGEWSDEVQVSPRDVPEYEDHTEPAITAFRNGVAVAWSWDFHPPNKGYSNQGKAPTIFMRTISDTTKIGDIFCVSGKNIDVTPVLAASDNRRIWCAWDSLGRGQQKELCISNVSPTRDNPISRILSADNPAANVCTPSLAIGGGGRVSLVWSETDDNSNWVLKRSDYNLDDKEWSAAGVIENHGNPRYCSAGYDRADNLWLAYSVESEDGRKIVVANSGKALLKSSDHGNNTEAISELRKAIDEKYSYSDLRGVDWEQMFDRYEPSMKRSKTAREFAGVASRMLHKAKDMHLWVKVDGKSVGGFKRTVKHNYRVDLLREEVPGWRDLSKYVSIGRLPDNVGYILIKSWRKDEEQVLKPALRAVRSLSNSRALIIDVRPNSGGSEPFAQKVAGCFVDQPLIYAKHVYKKSNSQTGWGQIQERILKPNKEMDQYRGKIAVLMGQANMSSCEAFLLMMKQIPNCMLIGEKSYGSSGNPKPYDLGNGVTVWFPSWKALRPDETCFEGQGIKPDISVKANERQLRKKDPVLESALKYLRR